MLGIDMFRIDLLTEDIDPTLEISRLQIRCRYLLTAACDPRIQRACLGLYALIFAFEIGSLGIGIVQVALSEAHPPVQLRQLHGQLIRLQQEVVQLVPALQLAQTKVLSRTLRLLLQRSYLLFQL